MSQRRATSFAAVCLLFAIVLGGGAVSAHTYLSYLGKYGPDLVRARVESPNASVADFPIRVSDTLSVVCFRVRNAPVPLLGDSRITAIGFDLAGDRTGFTLISPTEGAFRLIEQVTNVPELPDVTLDFALVTGRTFGGGNPHNGLAPSGALTTFCVSGPFDQQLPIETMLDRGVVRFQSVGQDGEAGDIATTQGQPF